MLDFITDLLSPFALLGVLGPIGMAVLPLSTLVAVACIALLRLQGATVWVAATLVGGAWAAVVFAFEGDFSSTFDLAHVLSVVLVLVGAGYIRWMLWLRGTGRDRVHIERLLATCAFVAFLSATTIPWMFLLSI